MSTFIVVWKPLSFLFLVSTEIYPHFYCQSVPRYLWVYFQVKVFTVKFCLEEELKWCSAHT